MRFPRTLARYVARETLQYAAVGFLAVASLFLANNLLRRLEDLAELGANAGDVLAVAARLLVILTTYALPISFLFGVLVALGRLGSDHEVLATHALGVSLAQLAAPVLALAVLASALSGWLLLQAEPLARRSLIERVGEVATRGGLIRGGDFTRLDKRGDRVLFVDRRSREGELEGVLLSDRSNPERPFTVLAGSGAFRFERETATGHLLLRDGDVHFEPGGAESDRTQRIAFRRFDYAFDLSRMTNLGLERLKPRDMTGAEIASVLAHFDEHGAAPPQAREQRREEYEVQQQRRRALPFAPLAFAWLALPLGLGRRRGARSLGALLCAAIAFGYYVLLNAGTAYATSGRLPPALALWLPNLVCALIAAPLWWRARRAEA
jgi:lipopolysaccharide export system permease protein